MSQARSANVPFLASLKANRVIWDYLPTRWLFCWDCKLGDVLFLEDEEHCKHNLGILPSVREVLALVCGSHAAAAGSGIVPEQTLLRYSAISEPILAPAGLPSSGPTHELFLPESNEDRGGEGGESDEGSEQTGDNDVRNEGLRVIVGSDIAFPNQEDDEQWGALPAPSRTRAGHAGLQCSIHSEPLVINRSSIRSPSPAPTNAPVEEREDIQEDESAEQISPSPSPRGDDTTDPQPIEGIHEIVQETVESAVRTLWASVSKKRTRPIRKQPGQRRKKTLRLSVIASQEDLVGMPSPSSLYEFALANPGKDFDVVDAMLPEIQQVCVTNRGVPAQETWQCRLGFAVPQKGCAQWMYDREPCHTSGFEKYEYIRHFYQFHLGLGRPSGVGNTRVDQLKAALVRCTESSHASPDHRKRSAGEMDEGDEPGPSRKKRRGVN